MRVHRGKALVAGLAILALGAAACSSGGGGGSKSSGSGQLIWGEPTAFPGNLMPIIAAGNSTAVANLQDRVLDGAYRVTPQITYQPDADQITSATSSVVNGQQVVDIKINPKAVWDDGKPITAADYIFTTEIQKSQDPKTGCPDILGTAGYDQIEKGVAVSDKEVKFTFLKGKPYADWKGLFAGGTAPIFSKHVMDQGSITKDCAYIKKGWPIANGQPPGTSNGPWLLLKKNIDTSKKVVTLVPNPKYWGAKPKLARLVYASIGSESDTNVKALKNQEVNIIYPQPQLDLVANLKQLTGVTTTVSFGVQFEHLDFNTKDKLLSHLQVRQAIALAIDRKALVSATVGKFSDKAQVLDNRIILNTQTGYEAHGQGYDTQNIAKAKQLLTSVGAKMGKDGYYSIGGKELSFKVITTQQNPLRDQTIQTIAAQVKQAGIKLTEFADPDIFEDKTHPNSLEAEGFQIALFAWVGTPSLSSNNAIYLTKGKGGGQNYSQCSNAQTDKDLNSLATAPNNAAELAFGNAADKTLWSQMCTLPLYQKPTLLSYTNNVTGLADNATSAGPLWNSDGFSVK